MIRAAPLPFTLMLLSSLGCSSGKTDVRAEFSGRSPYGAIYDDNREVVAKCPRCGQPVPQQAARCAHRGKDGRECGQKLRWTSKVPCGFCAGSGSCDPCAAFLAAGGCRLCSGSGRLKERPCFNCDGSGACVACGGTSRCDACVGSGRIEPGAWKKPPRAATSRARTAEQRPAFQVDRFAVWRGQSVQLSLAGAAGQADWSISRGEGGKTIQTATLSGATCTYTPGLAGSYIVRLSAGGTACFEVLDGALNVGVPEGQPIGPATSVRATFDLAPPLRPFPRRWDARLGGAAIPSSGGERIDLSPGKAGELVLDASVEIPNLGSLPGPRSVRLQVRDVRISLKARTCAGGQPLKCEAVGDISGSGGKFEWSATSGSHAVAVRTDTPEAEIVPPAPGKYRLNLRVGTCDAAAEEFKAVGATAFRPDGSPAEFLRVSLMEGAFDERGAVRPDFLDRDPDRFRISLEDPSPAGEGSFQIRTVRADGTELNPPVSYRGRASPELLVVGDSHDDEIRTGGVVDDGPGDRTLFGVVGGKLEVHYDGLRVAAIPVTVENLTEIGIDAMVYGVTGGVQSARRSVERRLEAVNRVWAPCGIRFALHSLRVADAPDAVILIHGIPSGVDSRGRPSEVAANVGGREIRVPLVRPAPGAPEAAARGVAALIESRLDEGWRVDVIAKLFASDPAAIVLRLRRADGEAARVGSAHTGDTGLTVELLKADLGMGCEVAATAGVWTRQELAVLLGVQRRPGAVAVIVVPSLRTAGARPITKAYPDWAFGADTANAVVIASKAMDGSDAFPYALARALGEVLAAGPCAPEGAKSLFADPLSETDDAEANRRLGRETARRIQAQAARLTRRP
ncbi:MAG: hypothetical protein HYY17_12175 [Planctomycetes bacterium]|nr:hypothetical protein [Planctomycetota bacterium]